MAAPVGVTNSFSIPLEKVGAPAAARSSAVAGAGTGRIPCSRFYAAGAYVQGRTTECIDSQELESDCGADDVDDRVYCAYFVEVHLVDGNLVDILASASPRLSKIAEARSVTRGGSFAASMIFRISVRPRA